MFNEAIVSSATADPDNDDVRASVPTVVESADLSVVKVDSPDPVLAGRNLTYTITVMNAGPSTAQAVKIVDTFPPARPTSAARTATGPRFAPSCKPVPSSAP